MKSNVELCRLIPVSLAAQPMILRKILLACGPGWPALETLRAGIGVINAEPP